MSPCNHELLQEGISFQLKGHYAFTIKTVIQLRKKLYEKLWVFWKGSLVNCWRPCYKSSGLASKIPWTPFITGDTTQVLKKKEKGKKKMAVSLAFTAQHEIVAAHHAGSWLTSVLSCPCHTTIHRFWCGAPIVILGKNEHRINISWKY